MGKGKNHQSRGRRIAKPAKEKHPCASQVLSHVINKAVAGTSRPTVSPFLVRAECIPSEPNWYRSIVQVRGKMYAVKSRNKSESAECAAILALLKEYPAEWNQKAGKPEWWNFSHHIDFRQSDALVRRSLNIELGDLWVALMTWFLMPSFFLSALFLDRHHREDTQVPTCCRWEAEEGLPQIPEPGWIQHRGMEKGKTRRERQCSFASSVSNVFIWLFPCNQACPATTVFTN